MRDVRFNSEADLIPGETARHFGEYREIVTHFHFC